MAALFKVGDIVRFKRDGDLGVVFDVAISDGKDARMWKALTGQIMYRYKVQQLDTPNSPSFWQTFEPGLVRVEHPTEDEKDAASAALDKALERHNINKEIRSEHRQNKTARAIKHMEENRLQAGHRVLVRGPKKQGDWEAVITQVDYKQGRLYIPKAGKWVSALSIIRTLEAIESELPCELSENTLDQLQDSGWAQFQTGRDLQRKTFIVAFTRDAAAKQGDEPSSEVFRDPSLGLYWRPIT